MTLEGWNNKDKYNDESQEVNDGLENYFAKITDSSIDYNKNALANLSDNLTKPFVKISKSIEKHSQKINSQNFLTPRYQLKNSNEPFFEKINEKKQTLYQNKTNDMSPVNQISEPAAMDVKIPNEILSRYMKSFKRQLGPQIKSITERKMEKKAFLSNLNLSNSRKQFSIPDINLIDLIQVPIIEESTNYNSNSIFTQKSWSIGHSKQLLNGCYQLPKIPEKVSNRPDDQILEQIERNSLQRITNNESLYISKAKNFFSQSKKLEPSNKSKEFTIPIRSKINNSPSNKTINNINESVSHNINNFKEAKYFKDPRKIIKEYDVIKSQTSLLSDENVYQVDKKNVNRTITMSNISDTIQNCNKFDNQFSKTGQKIQEKVKYSSKQNMTQEILPYFYEKYKGPEKRKQIIGEYNEQFLNYSLNLNSSPQQIDKVGNKIKLNYETNLTPSKKTFIQNVEKSSQKIKDFNEGRAINNEVIIFKN